MNSVVALCFLMCTAQTPTVDAGSLSGVRVTDYRLGSATATIDISAKIVDASGNPVQDALVEVFQLEEYGDRDNALAVAATKTGADGTAALQHPVLYTYPVDANGTTPVDTPTWFTGPLWLLLVSHPNFAPQIIRLKSSTQQPATEQPIYAAAPTPPSSTRPTPPPTEATAYRNPEFLIILRPPGSQPSLQSNVHESLKKAFLNSK